jgi:hypothetical protein
MKNLIGLLVVFAVAGVWLPAMAQEVYDQSVYLLQSRDLGNPTQYQVDLCAAKAAEVPARLPGTLVNTIPLNAEWWMFQTRAKDGMVKSEFIRKVGTVDGCAFFVLTESGLRIALYGESKTEALDFDGWGECDLPIAGMPTPASQTGTCTTIIRPDTSQGVAGGIGTSNSVFGEATGSFWTVRIFWE